MEGRFNGGFFALPLWGGLYFGGAYFRNFTVFHTLNVEQRALYKTILK